MSIELARGAPGVARAQRRTSAMFRTAAALMLSTVGSAALGFVFWIVAARWFPADVFGRASAVVSSMTLLASLAQLNLTSVFARFLPSAGRRTRRLILGGYAACAGTALVLSLGFVLSGLGKGLVGAGPWWALLFIVTVIASALFYVLDGVLATVRRASWVPTKNVVTAAAKLLLLPVFAGVAAGSGILLAWSLPALVAVSAVTWWVLAKLGPAHAIQSARGRTRPTRREVVGFFRAEYVNSLISNAVAFIPPVLVARVLGAEESAYFYVPWLIGVATSTLLWNVVTSFVVEASNAGSAARTHVIRAVRLGLAVIVPASLIMVVAAGPLLRVLGPAYAEHGTLALRLIGLSVPFSGAILLYAAFCVMDKRMWALSAVQAVSALLFLGGAWWSLPHLGATGPALAFLICQAATALVLAPALLRRHRAGAQA